jgi:putative MFS transporter
MNIAVNAGARLDRIPFGSFHWRMLRLIGLGIFFDGFDNSMGPSVLAALTDSGWSNMATNANFISVTFAGLALGAFLSGVLGDRLGRRFAYQFNLAIFGFTCLLSAVAPSMIWLIVLRGIMGVGIGAEYVIGYSMACEFVPPQRRGWALGLMAFASMSSGFVVSLLAVLIIPHFGWRPLYVIGGSGALFVWFLRRKLPESPRWLERMGRREEAERVISAIEREASPDAPLPPPRIAAEAARDGWVPVSVLVSRPVIKRTALATWTCISVMVGSYSFISWVPSLFVEQGYSLSRSLSFSTIMAFGNIIGPATCIFISDRIGRRKAMIVAAACCGIAALAYSQQTGLFGLLALGLAVTALMSLLMGLGVGGYSPELFPTEYRLRGNGIAQTVGRVAVVLSPYIVVRLFHGFGIPGVMGWICAIYLTLAAVLTLFGIETNQRPLEDLDPERDQLSVGVPSQVPGSITG